MDRQTDRQMDRQTDGRTESKTVLRYDKCSDLSHRVEFL